MKSASCESLSSTALLPSSAWVAQSRVCRASLSVPYTADDKYGGCRHRIVFYGVIMTQREYCTCGCSLSRPTLERLSWQRRRTRTRSLRIMNCVRVLGYVTWQNRIRKLLHSVVTFSVLASTLARQAVIFFLAIRVSSGVPDSPAVFFSLHGDPSFTLLRLVKHYDFSTA